LARPEAHTVGLSGARLPSRRAMPLTEKSDANVAKGSVEQTYQKLTQHQHILQRPDTYVGSIESVTAEAWVFDAEAGRMRQRKVSYVPGLYKIFDEILVNAADNKQRDASMSEIRVEIDREANRVSVMNNGKGIPVVVHKEHQIYVPELIFGAPHALYSARAPGRTTPLRARASAERAPAIAKKRSRKITSALPRAQATCSRRPITTTSRRR
jgi:CRISPR/Cas system CSM-associated protein Csm2 small subunit